MLSWAYNLTMNEITRSLDIVKYYSAGKITKNLYIVFTFQNKFQKTSNEKSQKHY